MVTGKDSRRRVGVNQAEQTAARASPCAASLPQNLQVARFAGRADIDAAAAGPSTSAAWPQERRAGRSTNDAPSHASVGANVPPAQDPAAAALTAGLIPTLASGFNRGVTTRVDRTLIPRFNPTVNLRLAQ